MKDKKKGFWLLTIIFGLLAMSALMVNLLTVTPGEDEGISMGGMMKAHHAENLKPGDLLKLSESDHSMNSNQGHHEVTPVMQNIAFFTTIIIFLLLPFLLGGTVLLLVLWI